VGNRLNDLDKRQKENFEYKKLRYIEEGGDTRKFNDNNEEWKSARVEAKQQAATSKKVNADIDKRFSTVYEPDRAQRKLDKEQEMLEKAAKLDATKPIGKYDASLNPVCEARAAAAEIRAKLRALLLKVGKARAIITKILMALKWFSKFAMAELLGLLSGVAGTLAAAALQGASALVAGALAKVFGFLLAILMTGPEAIFGLITIPYDEAVKASAAERRALNDMAKYLNRLIALINKLKGLGDISIEDDIRAAMKHISAAIAGLNRLIELDYIDKVIYKNVLKSTGKAIKILKPSNLSMFGGLGGEAEKLTQEKILEEQRKLIPGVKKKYSEERKALADERAQKLSEVKEFKFTIKPVTFDEVDNFDSNGIKIDRNKMRKKYADNANSYISKEGGAARVDLINEWYSKEIADINKREKSELESVKLDASVNASSDMFKIYGQAAKNYAASAMQQASMFVTEMAECIAMITTSLAIAQAKHSVKRGTIKTLINFETFIMNIITFILELLGKINRSDDMADLIFKGAAKNLEEANEILGDSVNLGYDDKASAYLGQMTAASVASIRLNLTDALLMATITDELIALTNSSRIFGKYTEEYQKFVDTLLEIRGFNAEKQWYFELFSESPYPAVNKSMSNASKKLATLQLGKINYAPIQAGYMSLVRHNRTVDRVLMAYQPVRNPLVAKLQKLLAMLNLTEAFAALGGLLAIIGTIKGLSLMGLACPRPEKPEVAAELEKANAYTTDAGLTTSAVHDQDLMNVKSKVPWLNSIGNSDPVVEPKGTNSTEFNATKDNKAYEGFMKSEPAKAPEEFDATKGI